MTICHYCGSFALHFKQTLPMQYVFAFAKTADGKSIVKVRYPSEFDETNFERYWPKEESDRLLFWSQIKWNEARQMFFCNLNTEQFGPNIFENIMKLQKCTLETILYSIWSRLNYHGRLYAIRCIWKSKSINRYFSLLASPLVLKKLLVLSEISEVLKQNWLLSNADCRMKWLCCKWWPEQINLIFYELFKPEYSCYDAVRQHRTLMISSIEEPTIKHIQAMIKDINMPSTFTLYISSIVSINMQENADYVL